MAQKNEQYRPQIDAILKNLPPNYLLGEGFILERYLNSPTDTPADELLTEVWLPIKAIPTKI